ncbi:hypothetical protein sr13075 [Sporisorium reilianum SRZ2]|uniref:Zn(2)-C6 fungal-type domain-containing protein n=1 Tax=Sporisorium reilianum (strain SRZ2) TaxID=999809 RepID=E6ZYR0_SPORE|nr:hypothetical protein sr13075 [Sporisorium reilianum SRZ2]
MSDQVSFNVGPDGRIVLPGLSPVIVGQRRRPRSPDNSNDERPRRHARRDDSIRSSTRIVPLRKRQIREILIEMHWSDEGCSTCFVEGLECLPPRPDSQVEKCQECSRAGDSCDCRWLLENSKISAMLAELHDVAEITYSPRFEEAERKMYGSLLGGPKDKRKDYPHVARSPPSPLAASSSRIRDSTPPNAARPQTPAVATTAAAPRETNRTPVTSFRTLPPAGGSLRASFLRRTVPTVDLRDVTTSAYEELYLSVNEAILTLEADLDVFAPSPRDSDLVRIYRRAWQAVYEAQGGRGYWYV